MQQDDTPSISANVDVTIEESDLNARNQPTSKEEFKNAIDEFLEQNAIIEHKLSRKNNNSKEQTASYEKKQFHLDTINMMTKYQIVFLKLETSLKKICANNEWRNELRKRKGFK